MRSVQQIAEEQIHKAQLAERRPARRAQSGARTPVVTVSREFWAGGESVGRAIADALGFTYWDQELLVRGAQETGTMVHVLTALDERVQSPVADYVESLLVGLEYSQEEYWRTVVRVVSEVARRGSAVLIGRASHLIVEPERALRVRVVCPLDLRIARLMQDEGLGKTEARRQIRTKEREISTFVRHRLNHDVASPEDFDLVVNTGTFTVLQAADIVVAAYYRRFPEQRARQLHEAMRPG